MMWQTDMQSPHIARRSKLETGVDILDALSSGIDKPTHIMYKANICWVVLKKHLAELSAQKLIEERDTGGHKRYAITEKGARTLEYLKKARDELLVPINVPS